MKEVISQEIIENFLNGGDPEEFIVGVEYDYPTNTIFKIIQDPEQGKIVKPDSYTPFLWVGDLTGLGFYNDSKALQKRAMAKHGIIIDKLETHGNERLEMGMKYLIKSINRLCNLTDRRSLRFIEVENPGNIYNFLTRCMARAEFFRFRQAL
jgi:hypothetical protein